MEESREGEDVQITIDNSVEVRSVKCSSCDFEINTNTIELYSDLFSLSVDHDLGKILAFTCPECRSYQTQKIDNDSYSKISSILDSINCFNDAELAGLNSVEFGVASADDESSFPTLLNPTTYDQNTPVAAPNNSSDKSIDNFELFQDKIKNFNKNLPDADRTSLIREYFKLLIDEPMSNVELCFRLIKDAFKLTAREIEAFRKDFHGIKTQADAAKKQENAKQFLEKFGKKPKVLTEQEKEEALAYLRNPKLIENISKDLTFAGEIIGEETNKMMLYLASISIKFKKPISLVIFGKSSSGKSHLANAVAKFIPDEDSIILSSSTLRAFDYAENLQHKFVLVQEYEGIENNLSTIRVLQSEGKLSRAVSVKSPDDATHKSIVVSNECSCSVVFTTTREDIHDENSTRIFELYADESIEQTENVVNNNILKSNIKYKNDEDQKKLLIELHKNVQRILEPIEVDIPFAEHIKFPAKSTRNRRDSERFIQLIKAVAFLRQKQKQVKEINGKRFIEADHYDYEIAFMIGLNVIAQTLDQFSERARNVLRVCCELTDDLKKAGQPMVITVRQIQEKAPTLGIEFRNRSDLDKQLKKLVDYEYLSLDQPKFNGKKNYTVIFDYVRDEKGEIMNIGTPEIRDITTPDQLREKLLTN
jgi:ABC-type dipeptide/oligopeptide/nickel transport system ATPase subunit